MYISILHGINYKRCEIFPSTILPIVPDTCQPATQSALICFFFLISFLPLSLGMSGTFLITS